MASTWIRGGMVLQAAGAVAVLSACATTSAAAPQTAPSAPTASSLQTPAAPRAPTPTELQAAVVRLQAQVLERDLEIGKLRTRVAELEMAQLSQSVATLPADVRKLLGLPDAAAAPAATPPSAPTPP